jgi:hypothetical protein
MAFRHMIVTRSCCADTRGLDDMANLKLISEDVTPEPAAAYFGAPAAAPATAHSVWALRGLLRAHKVGHAAVKI